MGLMESSKLGKGVGGLSDKEILRVGSGERGFHHQWFKPNFHLKRLDMF